MAKIGRNSPCPCGSGKKFKQCCIGKSQFESSMVTDADFDQPRIRTPKAELVLRILLFAQMRYGDEIFRAARDEFEIWGEYELDEIHQETMFPSWFAFNAIAETEEGAVPERTTSSTSMGLEFLHENEDQLDEFEKAFIREASSQPYSFFVVTRTVPGKNVQIHDFFLDRVFELEEQEFSRKLNRGDVLFSRVLQWEGQTIMLGMAPFILPPTEHLSLLEVRDGINEKLRDRGMVLDQNLLYDLDLEMREVYLYVVELLTHPRTPELRNSNGDPFILQKLFFVLKCTPQEALNALKSLSLPQFYEDIPENSTLDREGHLVTASFAWLRKGNKKNSEWDNTILGQIMIDHQELIVEVNSEKRAKKIQSEIKKRLGTRAAFKRAEQQSPEIIPEDFDSRRPTQDSEDDRRSIEELKSRPEVQGLLRKQMEAQWEAWYNEPVPALNNETPIQAARTNAGRERLEVLLTLFERGNDEISDEYLHADIQAMRKRLGLSK